MNSTSPTIPTVRQKQAIEADLGPVLVLAGPGAGKTFCLIERIRYLVTVKGFDPARICAVTFTNKAAGEIASRLSGALGGSADLVTRSTIHALCVQILREHGEMIGVPVGFGIADDEYQRQALRRAGFRKDAAWPLGHFSRHRMQGTPLDDWLQPIYERYREILARRNLLDFDDLVMKTEQLLRSHQDVAAEVAGRWDYVLVDECQDLNPQQYAIIRYLVPHDNCFAVGDDDQSIYAWAGADPRILRGFLNDFRMARYVELDENRRSSRQIFELARRLVEYNPQLFDFQKVLRATRESPFAVTVQRFGNEEEEARWLIADLQRDQLEHRYAWGESAILYRRHDSGEVLEAMLVEAGIPCQLAQGRAIADDPVVRYLVTALKIIADPADPILGEQFARVVLPSHVYSSIRSEAERNRIEFVEQLKLVDSRDEDGKKARRCRYAIANLPGLTDRHLNLTGLIEELLSQRVGEYRTILEEHADELSDPAVAPGAPELKARLLPARHGRGRIWMHRNGGVELALGGMLRLAGFTMVDYLDDRSLITPYPDDVYLDTSVTPLALFKALQLIRGLDLPPGLADFTAVDIETTDNVLETAELVELAAVRVRKGEIVAEFSSKVKPVGPISPRATEVHGYTAADLAEAPAFAEVWTRFRAFAGDDILVAHNGHGFDFPILRRHAAGHPAGDHFAAYDSLLLARALHPGSRKLQDLAVHYGIEAGRAHHALDDTRTLARVFLRLEQDKLARARKTSHVNLLDQLAIGLALSDPATMTDEGRMLLGLGKLFALGRYSQSLAQYEAERAQPGGEAAPDVEQLIARLGGRDLMARLRREKKAVDRYPEAMARLRRILELSSGGTLMEQLVSFLERITLSQSRSVELDPDRVSLLTLHSTKGLEFSRVYVIGVEDGQLPGGQGQSGREPSAHEVEEGRRLLYVGMTRAKDRLVLTRAEERGGLPSGGERYLREMGLGVGRVS
jgi:superfamily I DNA/RNA helicase